MYSRMFCAGSTMVLCVIVLTVVATLAIGLASMAGAKLQMAHNNHYADAAFFNAESELEVMRYWLARVTVPSSTPPSDYLSTVIDAVQTDLEANSITGLALGDDGSIPTVDLLGGDHGEVAIDKHVNIGADQVEFPVPDLTAFYSYATGAVLDPNTDLSSSMTLANAVIPANVNPTFLGNITIQGILLIKQPNIVTFTRNVELQGMIVADGDVLNPGTNAISFQGNFSSQDYPADPMFDAIRQEQGSAILAPGFGVSFTGNFASVNGVIAASSLYFASNASATVKGTMISYSADATYVDGNISMEFDRATAVEIPAGFDLLRVLNYDPNSYCMAR